MNLILSYNDFSGKEIYEQIDYMDNFNSVVESNDKVAPKVFTTFLAQIYNSETNLYIRKKSLENLFYLTMNGKVRSVFTQNFLFDIDDEEDSFILVLKIKYLYYLYAGEDETIRILKFLSESNNGDVVGESYFRLGLITFFGINEVNGFEDLLSRLKDALKYFRFSFDSNENRIDAEFYINVTNFLINTIESSNNDLILKVLAKNLLQRQIHSINNNFPFIDNAIYNSLLKINDLFEISRNEPSWNDFKKEFTNLAYLFHELLSLEVNDNFIEKKTFENFKTTLQESFVHPYFKNNLLATQSRIDALINQLQDKTTVNFLQNLKVLLSSNQEKKNSWNLNTSISQLYKILPNKTIQEVQNILENQDLNNILDIIISNSQPLSQPKYLTGYSNTEEVLFTIIEEIKVKLPSYSNIKLESVKNVAADIIRYVYDTLTLDKSFYPELYDPNEKKEETFQNSLYRDLRKTMNCRFYEYEKNVAGRIDIFYTDGTFNCPIEVKKTNKITTFDKIKENYIAQIQAYTQPYDQIGFLTVFDISKKTSSLNSISSLFKVINIEPQYKLNNNIFDYIIVAIIPANKVLPSSMTNY